MVGIDHDEVVLKAIKDGYRQRHDAAEPLWPGLHRLVRGRRLRNGCTVKEDAPFKSNALTNRFIDSGTVFAGKDAVDNYVASMQAITKDIMKTFEKTYLACK